MNKKNYLSRHTKLNIILFAVLIILMISNTIQALIYFGPTFNIATQVNTIVMEGLFAAFALAPLFYSVYRFYTKSAYLSKKIMNGVLVPFLGAILIPALMIILCYTTDNGYMGAFGFIFLTQNMVFYIANEILIYFNLKQFKKS